MVLPLIPIIIITVISIFTFVVTPVGETIYNAITGTEPEIIPEQTESSGVQESLQGIFDYLRETGEEFSQDLDVQSDVNIIETTNDEVGDFVDASVDVGESSIDLFSKFHHWAVTGILVLSPLEVAYSLIFIVAGIIAFLIFLKFFRKFSTHALIIVLIIGVIVALILLVGADISI